MKILSVIETLGHGGAETVLITLALNLREHEHRVVHASRANGVVPHASFLAALERRRIRAIDTHWSVLGYRRGRAEVLAGFRPDVVLFHWWGNDPWRRWIAAMADVPPARRPCFVLVLHHAGIPAPRGYDHYVLVSETQREQVAHAPAERVQVIPNGIEVRRYRRRRTPRASDEMVVGRVSSLRGGKIPADWIDTAASFGLRNTRFVIAGDGTLRSALQQRVAALGHEERFTFPGYVPRFQVADVLERFDVFCYATSTAVECHPLALVEALAAGVPVVAEARGGIPEIVTHGVNGLLATSPSELGDHLHALRRDGALRDRLVHGARASAGRFSVARQLASYRALLREVARTRGGEPRRRPAAES